MTDYKISQERVEKIRELIARGYAMDDVGKAVYGPNRDDLSIYQPGARPVAIRRGKKKD